MTSAGDILGGGFGLIVRRPGAVAVWAAILAVIGLGALMLLLPGMMASFQALSTLDPDALRSGDDMAALQSMNANAGLSGLFNLVQYFVQAVLLCAAFRATVRPQEGGFAFLRVGWDELRIFGMMLVTMIALAIAAVIFFLLVLLVSMVLGFALQSVPALQYLLIALVWIAAFCAMIYALVRISLMLPLTFIRRQLVIDEAWGLVRGRFWTLFLPILAIAVIIGVVMCIAILPLIWGMTSEAIVAAQSLQAPEAAKAGMQAMFARWGAHPLETFGPMLLLGSVVGTLYLALMGGALATAALGFLADDGKLPEELLPPEPGTE